MVKKSLDLGYDLYDVLRAASYNPAMHYKIPAGFLREGDSADFIQVNNLKDLPYRQPIYKEPVYTMERNARFHSKSLYIVIISTRNRSH